MATVDKLHIGPADHGRAMTLDEFREADEEEGYRYELARGVLEVTEVPNDPHRQIVFNLYQALARYHQAHPDCIHCYGGGPNSASGSPGCSPGATRTSPSS
jgi:hypothetical protein